MYIILLWCRWEASQYVIFKGGICVKTEHQHYLKYSCSCLYDHWNNNCFSDHTINNVIIISFYELGTPTRNSYKNRQQIGFQINPLLVNAQFSFLLRTWLYTSQRMPHFTLWKTIPVFCSANWRQKNSNPKMREFENNKIMITNLPLFWDSLRCTECNHMMVKLELIP